MPSEATQKEFTVREFRGAGDALPAAEILMEVRQAASWSPATLSQLLALKGVLAFFSERLGVPTGFIVGRQLVDEGEILNLAVKAGFRRQGEGRALVERLLEGFRQRGIVKVFLEVRESNQPAVSFYESFGFRQVGRRGEYYRHPEEAALILRKNL
jgi:ribosomal-protein-alanine N-acetyltransferase